MCNTTHISARDPLNARRGHCVLVIQLEARDGNVHSQDVIKSHMVFLFLPNSHNQYSRATIVSREFNNRCTSFTI